MIKSVLLMRDARNSNDHYWCKPRRDEDDFPELSMLCCGKGDKLWPKLEQAKTMRICLAPTEEQIDKPHPDAMQIEHYDPDENGESPSWSFVTVFIDEENEKSQELTNAAMDWVAENYKEDETLWVWVEIDS